MVYLADIFTYFNELNTSLQGTNINIFKVQSKIDALKLKFWADCILKGNIECFPNLHNIIVDSKNVKNNLVQQLSDLQKTFLEYFPVQIEKLSWIQNPFQDCDTSELPIKEREQQIDISTDTQLKLKFNQVDIMHFWIDIRNEYPEIAKSCETSNVICINLYIRKIFLFVCCHKNKIQKQIGC